MSVYVPRLSKALTANVQLRLIPIGHWDQSQCPIGIDPNWTLGSIPMSNWDQSQLDIGTWKYDLENCVNIMNCGLYTTTEYIPVCHKAECRGKEEPMSYSPVQLEQEL